MQLSNFIRAAIYRSMGKKAAIQFESGVHFSGNRWNLLNECVQVGLCDWSTWTERRRYTQNRKLDLKTTESGSGSIMVRFEWEPTPTGSYCVPPSSVVYWDVRNPGRRKTIHLEWSSIEDNSLFEHDACLPDFIKLALDELGFHGLDDSDTEPQHPGED